MIALLKDLLRPCKLVLAHPDAPYAASVGRTFRQLGWEVHHALDGPEARRGARRLRAELVVLAVDLPGESGWLTCAKLMREQPASRVVLVGEASPRNRELADFVGACVLVSREESLAAILAQQAAPRSAAG